MRARPRFEGEDLKRFEERMKNIEWDNEKGKGVLSDEAIEKIKQPVVQEAYTFQNSFFINNYKKFINEK